MVCHRIAPDHILEALRLLRSLPGDAFVEDDASGADPSIDGPSYLRWGAGLEG